jgi:AcrR family transcriptional regulator
MVKFRADALRNREKILGAAVELFERDGVEAVTMDAVARAAGVSKGTVFHRFGSRAGLAMALLDEAERELQEALLRGRAPLGPGAPAAARLTAFLAAYVDLLAGHHALVRTSEHEGEEGRALSHRRLRRLAPARHAAAARARHRARARAHGPPAARDGRLRALPRAGRR